MVSAGSDKFLSFGIVALLGATIFLLTFLETDHTDDRILLPPPPPGLQYFSFGFNESIGDSLWLDYIQHIDSCLPLAHETDHKIANCRKGWTFHMLDSITELAPRFRMAYAVGPLALSVLNGDLDGADVIFERAIQAYPKDWSILYRAAYHYIYDKKDDKKAANLLMEAYKYGGPTWLPIMASRLYSEEGQVDVGISVLKTYIEESDKEKTKQYESRIGKRLKFLLCRKQELSEQRIPAGAKSTCVEESSAFGG